MRERYRDLPFAYVGHSFGGQALGLLPNNAEIPRALLIASQAAALEADGLARALPRRRLHERHRPAADRALGYMPGWAGLGMRPAEGRVRAMARLGDARALSARRPGAWPRAKIFRSSRASSRALSMTDDTWATRPAVELLCSAFTSITPEIIAISPADAGVPRRSAISASSAPNTATRCGAAPAAVARGGRNQAPHAPLRFHQRSLIDLSTPIIVVPAQTGTHTPPATVLTRDSSFRHRRDNSRTRWLPVPACAGTTVGMLARLVNHASRILATSLPEASLFVPPL